MEALGVVSEIWVDGSGTLGAPVLATEEEVFPRLVLFATAARRTHRGVSLGRHVVER